MTDLAELVRALFVYLQLDLPADLGGVNIESNCGHRLMPDGVVLRSDEVLTIKTGAHKITLTVRIHQ